MEQHPNKPVQAIVVLVHGTWARNAKWTAADSTFSREVLARLPGTYQVRQFAWSGRNSPKERQKAAVRLRDILRGLTVEFPEAAHFVVGHSHGGNIAVKAVEDIRLAERVKVVCLSTPFFPALPRRLATKPAAIGAAFGFTLLMVTMLYLWFGLKVGPTREHLDLLERSLEAVIWKHGAWVPVGMSWREIAGGFGVFLLPVLSSTIALATFESVTNRVNSWINELSANASAKTDLMLVRAVADEASSALATFQFFSWFITEATRLYAVPMERLRNWAFTTIKRIVAWEATPSGGRYKTWYLLVFVATLTTTVIVGQRMQPGSSAGWLQNVVGIHILGVIFAALCTVSILLFVPFAVVGTIALLSLPAMELNMSIVILPLLFLVMVVFTPLGYRTVLMSLFFEISVEPCPPGTWKIIQLEPQSDYSGLLHSSTYSDPRALSLILSWMSERCRRSETLTLRDEGAVW